MKLHYQVSDHGCGRISVQVFDESTLGESTLVADRAIVRDVDGWRVAGQKYDRPQHATQDACARHFTTLLHDELSAAL